MAINLDQNPYYDDFDPTKNYQRILFRPSYAVQARELTQLQTVLQDQVSKFGFSIYKNGSIVTGGQTTLESSSVQYVCIEATDPNGIAVNVNNFIGRFIIDGDGAGIRAYVIAASQATLTSPTVLIVKYTSGQSFNIATTNPIQTDTGDFKVRLLASLVTPINFTDVTSGSILGNSSICSVDAGVFFVNGFFVQVAPQTVILDAFDNTPTFRVGLQINDAIIDSTSDSSLLDPAVGATNFQAPGANRYQVKLTFVKRSITSTDDTTFIELLRVVNGKLTKQLVYPVYSVLDDTLARRTNDQSGSFTVRPFKIAIDDDPVFSNALSIVVEAGKAYVLGYEFETIGPFYIKTERARTVSNVSHYNTTFDYQNWIEVTNLVGPIPFKTLEPATLHCVNTASIITANAASAQNTAIGTIRILAAQYQTGANATSIQTGVWRAYMAQTNVGSSLLSNCKGGVTGTANSFYLANNFSSVSNAYVGIKFTITTNAGISIGESHQIGRYDGPNNLAYLTGTDTFIFGIPTVQTQYQLNYELKDVESLVYANTSVNQNQFSTTMDVNPTSKEPVAIDPFRGTFLTDTNFNTVLFKLPNFMIANRTAPNVLPVGNSSYLGRKIFVNQSFSANVISVTSAVGITSAVNGSPISGSDALTNFLVIIRGNTGTTIANNQVINFASGNPNLNTVSVTTSSNTSTWTFTVPGAGSTAQADVYVNVNLPFSDTLGSLFRTKTSHIANTQAGLTSGGIQIADSLGLVQWYSQGAGTGGVQLTVYANSAAWLNLRDSTKSQSLYTADGIRLSKVIDIGHNAISDANVQSGVDITSSYTFNTGQRDNFYDHAFITLKPHTPGPVGTTVIYLDYFSHSGLGYLTVDSYISANIAYTAIPSFSSPTSGTFYFLRDSIDFRPRRQDASATAFYDEEIFGIAGDNFVTDFSYYLSRIDKMILTKDRTFEVLAGVPSLTPIAPKDRDNAMTLYTLFLPAYTPNTSDVIQTYISNRRYTMSDIGSLDKRITNLEYYTSLSLNEQAAKNTEIIDETGAVRFKNGILVDPFNGHGVGDVNNPDYFCSIDPINNELRPAFNLNALLLDFNAAGSTHYQRKGSIFSLPYTEATLVDQPFAAIAINVNPFNVVSFIGTIKLDPSSDVWVDTTRLPDVNVNLQGNNDAWQAVSDLINQHPTGVFGTQWDSWRTVWTGISTYNYTWQESGAPGFEDGALGVFRTTYTTTTQNQVRTGVKTTVVPQTITTSIGDRIIDSSIIPVIRSRGVLFVGKMFAPNTNLFCFFDDVAVTDYSNKLNIIKVSSPTVQYQDAYQNNEIVRVWDSGGNKNTAFATVVLSRNEPTYSNVTVANLMGGDDANIANAYVVSSTNSTFLIGETSGANSQISGYYHNTGFCVNPTANTLILSHDMANSNTGLSNTTIVGQRIAFTSANGAGQDSIISTYDFTQRLVTFSPPVAVTPNTSTEYSIGQFSTDYRGEIAGLFIIPSTNTVNFRTGERQFKLVDSLSGSVASSATNGVVKYLAQGTLETVQGTNISTRTLGVQRTTVQDTQTVNNTKVSTQLLYYNWYDPLAETFHIDQQGHPSGIMLTGVRLLFKTKDNNIPLQVQIRPVVNGFPHATQYLPGSLVVVNPTSILTVDETTLGTKYSNTGPGGNNPLDDPSMYTQIEFDSPVYLPGGQDFAIVLIANSVAYQVYISDLGMPIIGTKRIISTPPYLGVLFKSQNASTWTPVQEQGLVFRLLYAQFDITSAANVEFRSSVSNKITSNVPVDTLYLTSGNLVLPNTTIDALYSTTTAAGFKEPSRTFQLDQNIYFYDTLGERVVTSDPNSYQTRFLLNSTNIDVSPLVDLDRLSAFCIQNYVNTLGLSNSLITVTNSSNNWTTAANLSVSISGGGGSKANAYISNNQIDLVNGVLSNVVVDIAGSQYTSAPNVVFSGNSTISATLSCAGEDRPFGGPAISRYITRKVTLADGMDAGDFRVYLTAYWPSSAQIYVYYKIMSADDPDVFDNKNYQLMTLIQGTAGTSIKQKDVFDFVFAPGTGGVAADRVQYGSFTTFKYFTIKIVMSSSDPTQVPRISNFRAIALPALS